MKRTTTGHAQRCAHLDAAAAAEAPAHRLGGIPQLARRLAHADHAQHVDVERGPAAKRVAVVGRQLAAGHGQNEQKAAAKAVQRRVMKGLHAWQSETRKIQQDSQRRGRVMKALSARPSTSTHSQSKQHVVEAELMHAQDAEQQATCSQASTRAARTLACAPRPSAASAASCRPCSAPSRPRPPRRAAPAPRA